MPSFMNSQKCLFGAMTDGVNLDSIIKNIRKVIIVKLASSYPKLVASTY